MFWFLKNSSVAFFFLFFLNGTSIGNGKQGISYNSFICAKSFANTTNNKNCKS